MPKRTITVTVFVALIVDRLHANARKFNVWNASKSATEKEKAIF